MTGLFDYILLFLGITFLGLLIALSPTLYITEIAIIKKSKKPLLHTVSLLAGVVLSLFIYTVIIWIFASPDKSYNLPSISTVMKNRPLFDILAGIALIGASYQVGKPKKEDKSKKAELRYEKLLNAKSLFLFGLLRTSTRMTSIAAIIIFVRFLKTYYAGEAVTLVLSVALLIVISVVPLVLTALIEKISPKNYQRVMSATGKMEGYNWSLIVSSLFVVAGLYFILIGITNFP